MRNGNKTTEIDDTLVCPENVRTDQFGAGERPSPSHQLRETLDQVNVLSDRAVGHSLLVVDL
jgi:hypothetical protein